MPKKRKITRRSLKGDTKFTRHVRGKVYEALKDRIPESRASRIAGVSHEAFMTWMRIGRDEPDTHPVHAQFRRRVIEIRRLLEAESHDIIRRAARGGDEVVETTVKMSPNGPEVTRTVKKERKQWQAAAWYLERRYPEDYAQRFISPGDDKRSPQETAEEIKGVFDAMMASVPTDGGRGVDAD